jgi:hypothetical protein
VDDRVGRRTEDGLPDGLRVEQVETGFAPSRRTRSALFGEVEVPITS